MSGSIEKIATNELVAELAKREGVEKIIAEPYADYTIRCGDHEISETGPAIILRVWD